MSISCFVSILLILLGVANPAHAANSRIIMFETQNDFTDGTLSGVKVDSSGRLTLGTPIESIWNSNEYSSAWSLAIDPAGSILVGTSGDAGILRITDTDAKIAFKPFEATGSSIHGLTILKSGQILAGTAPDGIIYRITSDGTSDVFFTTDQSYVWSIIEDKDGDIWIATGAASQIIQCSAEGSVRNKWELPAEHARCMTISDNKVWVGTANPGTIFCIENNDIRAIYSASEAEISSIRSGRNGVIWFCGVSATNFAVADEKLQRGSAGTGNSGEKMDYNSVYRLDRNLVVEQWWSTTLIPVYDVILHNDVPIVSCGAKGHLFSLDAANKATALGSHGSKPIIRLGQSDSGILGVTGGGAELVRMKTIKSGLEGVIESRVMSFPNTTRWGQLSVGFCDRTDSHMQAETRSGNTLIPDEFWSDWISVKLNSGTGVVESPPGMNLQWKLRFPGNADSTEQVTHVSISTVAINRAPRISNIVVYPVKKGIFADQPGGAGKVYRQEFDDGLRVEYQIRTRTPSGGFGKGEWFKLRGMRTIAWDGTDPDGDSLNYTISLSPIQTDRWSELVRDVTDPVFSFDSTAFPDGVYVIRIIASDLPTNPKNTEKTCFDVSRPFRIDNTPPLISNLHAWESPDPPVIRIEGLASDTNSWIGSCEFSTDTESWIEFSSSDGILDSRTESFRVDIPKIDAQQIFIRVTDEHENSATFSTSIEQTRRLSKDE